MRWRLLLVIPLVAILLGPLYARHSPDLLGIAFFYWYELACVIVSAAVTFIVFPSPRPARQAFVADEPCFSRDPSIRRHPSRTRPSRTFTRAG
jgi:hypothetical protein